MCAAIEHRGPDAGGIRSIGPGTCFGHRRLAILDLDVRSNQPFIRGDLTLVFNGEIYNFREIREELRATVTFSTTSDTEVLLEAWRAWGVGALTRLRGMFAFAIHDARSQKTWLVRDHFGIKPLFFLPLKTGGLAFASELKALERAYGSQLELDLSAFAVSLVWCWVPDSFAPWRQISKLRPGRYVEVAPDGSYRAEVYFDATSLGGLPLDLNDDRSAVDALAAALEDSVRAHMVADVPICAFLSGGLDSSLLVAIARRYAERLDCFTIRFSSGDQSHERMADDAVYAGIAARSLDVKLNVIESCPDMVELLPKIVRTLDEPIGDSAAIPTYLICSAAREQGVKVLLSGMGADELFAGYRKHYACVLARRYRMLLPGVLQNTVKQVLSVLPVASAAKGFRPVRWARRFTDFASLPEEKAFRRSYSYFGAESFRSLVVGDTGDAFERDAEEHARIYGASRADFVNRMCLTDVQRFMVGLNQTYTDRASMAASTEVRVPYIDRRVADVAFRMPGAMKLRGSVAKFPLKRVAERWLPREIIYRSKSPFTLPLRSWIKKQLVDVVDEYVLSSRGLAGRGWLSPVELRRLVEDNAAGRADNAQIIWQLLTMEQWFRNHRV
jgi:asparagine synthase (glutamine-hydrolysing)